MIHPVTWTTEESKATLVALRSIASLNGPRQFLLRRRNSSMLGFTPPYVSTGEGFHPDDFIASYRRGRNATHSFVDTWDFWPVLERQVDDLRLEFRIEKI